MGCAPSRYGERVSSEAEWAVAVRASQTREAHEQERQEDEALAAALEPGGSEAQEEGQQGDPFAPVSVDLVG